MDTTLDSGMAALLGSLVFSANISLEEIRALTRFLETDPLKSFGEACRAELKSIRAAG
jgi:hypothetical protein